MRPLRQLLIILPRRQIERLLSRLVIHFVGVDVVTALAVAVDGPRAPLYHYVLGVAFVSYEERSYGGFLGTFFYHLVMVHDGYLASASGASVGASLPEPNSLIRGTSFRRGQDSPAAALFGSSQRPLGL
jgi:hypothetical protein